MSTTGFSSDLRGKDLLGVILAAGNGRRMGFQGENLPKALFPVNGGTILSHQIELLESLQIRQVYLVVRHLKEIVAKYVEDHLCRRSLNITLVEQPSARNGIGAALQAVESRLDGPFVLFLGDIFMRPFGFQRLPVLVQKGLCDAVLAVAWESRPEYLARNFSVEADREGWVRRVVEKPKATAAGLKGCGVYCFNPRIFEALKRTPCDGRGELGLTQSIQTMIDAGHRVRSVTVSEWDVNLTTPADLQLCNQYLHSDELDRKGRNCAENIMFAC